MAAKRKFQINSKIILGHTENNKLKTMKRMNRYINLPLFFFFFNFFLFYNQVGCLFFFSKRKRSAFSFSSLHLLPLSLFLS